MTMIKSVKMPLPIVLATIALTGAMADATPWLEMAIAAATTYGCKDKARTHNSELSVCGLKLEITKRDSQKVMPILSIGHFEL